MTRFSGYGVDITFGSSLGTGGYVSRQAREFLLAGNSGPTVCNVRKSAGNSV